MKAPISCGSRTRVITASCLLLAAAHANSQTNQPDMEVVEVTGQAVPKRGLSLESENSAGSRLGTRMLDLPASVSVISKEALQVKGDFSGLSAVTRAPGFAASASPGNGGTSTSVRGFNGHSSVVNTYDGTRLYVGAGTVSFPADTWTVERIEVLRGPGSVINGIGAIGATVNFVPKKPTFEPIRSEVAVTAGSFDLQRYALGSGGQIDENFAYRLDAVYHSTDGYIDRADEERRAVAGALLWKLSEDLQVRLSVDWADTEAAPYWGTPLVDGDIPNDIRRNNYNVADGLVEYEDTWPRVHVAWQINDSVRLRSDVYYLEADRHWRNAESYAYVEETGLVDREFYLEILHDQEQLGTRNDLLFDFDFAGMGSRVSVGMEVNQIDFAHTNNSPYDGLTSVDLTNPNPGTWDEGVVNETTPDYDTDTLQYAVFFDGVLEVNDNWQVAAGVRYDDIDYEREDFARSNGQQAGEIDTDFTGTSWRLGGVYKPNEDTSIYAQYSKALDGIQSLLTATNPDLDLADGEQWELGFKQQLLDGQLQYTVALYDITKNNLITSDPGGVQRQIGQQSSQGIEFELYWRPLSVFSVELNMAFSDPEYDQFARGGDDFSGNTPRGVPEETGNLWLTWQALPGWNVSGGARYVGERYLDDANTVALPDYTVYDATLQWQANENLVFALRGKNLSDTDDFVLSPYGDQWILGDGRSVEVGVRFGL